MLSKFTNLAFVAVLLLAACSPSQPIPSASPALTQTDVSTPSDTATIEPSATHIATVTPTPTTAPTKTATATTRPTATALPPTETPTPLAFTGRGDSVIDVPDICACVAHIVGNAASRYFSVKGLDAAGNDVDLLVSATDAYDGYRPLDFYDRENTTRLQITANGDWSIELTQLGNYARYQKVPGAVTGTGDDLVLMLGGTPDLLKIKGNAAGRYFGVYGWSTKGKDLLVSDTNPYEGTVVVKNNAFVIEVVAVGDWTMDVTVK